MLGLEVSFRYAWFFFSHGHKSPFLGEQLLFNSAEKPMAVRYSPQLLNFAFFPFCLVPFVPPFF